MRQPILFGKYLLLERISVGGMAEVFKAKSFGEEGFEKILAIKRILPSMAEDDDFIQMFIDEAKISGQLSHPNIGQIYELGKIGDSHFIAMEFVWGKDVLQIQNRFRRLRQKMPIPMAVYVASRVCEALDYAHRKKDENGSDLHIVHRDVSPQNVLVSYAGEVKLIDFGIAKARSRSSKTQAGVLKGKFGYMSPEQVRGLPLNQRSDVFAVGTLLYEMATGERLFTGESDFATLEKVRNALAPRPSRVDPRILPALEAIILTALQRDPDERYVSAAELQEELTAFLMTQNPIFTSKALANSMAKIFEVERKREEEALQQYLAIRKEDLASYHASPSRLEPAVSLLEVARPEPDRSLAPRTRPSAEIVRLVAESSGEVLNTDDLVEVDEEQEHDSTQIYAESSLMAAAEAPRPPEPMSGEPTFIFNGESGQLVHMAEQSTVIFGPAGEENSGPRAEAPEQGPTVIFDAGLSSAVAGTAALPSADQASGTMPVPLERPGTVVKDIMIGVLVAVVLILGIVVWKVFSQANRPPVLATVVLSAIPPLSAEVLVDGVPRGSLEPGVPLSVKNLKPAMHQILVRAPGLRAVEQRVLLAAGEVKVLSIALPVPRDSGHLALEVQPVGVRVAIDGTEISAHAAGALIELRAGVKHELRVFKEGYEDSLQVLELRPGERVERKVVLLKATRGPQEPKKALRPEPKKAERPEPKKAERPEPKKALRPEPKKAERPEPKKVVRPEPKKAERPEPRKALRPEPRKAERPEPKEAERPEPKKVVRPEPKKAERPEPKKAERPEPKKAERPEPKKAERPEPRKAESQEPRKAESQEPNKDPTDAETGYLVANTVPWAKVLVDGKDTGKTTPVAPRQKIALKQGRHKVTFVAEGKEFTFTISITAGQITRVLKKLPIE